MKLYHFTAAHLWPSIRREGITRGVLPTLEQSGEIGITRGWQWLTENDSFEQSWCDSAHKSLPYDRNEVRITVCIPKAHRHTLMTWLEMATYLPLTAAMLNSYGDPEHWFIFKGKIPPGWFRGVTLKKNLQKP